MEIEPSFIDYEHFYTLQKEVMETVHWKLRISTTWSRALRKIENDTFVLLGMKVQSSVTDEQSYKDQVDKAVKRKVVK